jgi:recombination protein RecR
MEGDTTAFYISKRLRDSHLKITAIARGIAIGGELEYADEITLGRSILGRIPYKI